jgi:fatty acid-binding protein DegV
LKKRRRISKKRCGRRAYKILKKRENLRKRKKSSEGKNNRERLDEEVVIVKNASPVLGAHAGSGAVAVAILKHPNYCGS